MKENRMCLEFKPAFSEFDGWHAAHIKKTAPTLAGLRLKISSVDSRDVFSLFFLLGGGY
jgi:hypothetical protein